MLKHDTLFPRISLHLARSSSASLGAFLGVVYGVFFYASWCLLGSSALADEAQQGKAASPASASHLSPRPVLAPPPPVKAGRAAPADVQKSTSSPAGPVPAHVDSASASANAAGGGREAGQPVHPASTGASLPRTGQVDTAPQGPPSAGLSKAGDDTALSSRQARGVSGEAGHAGQGQGSLTQAPAHPASPSPSLTPEGRRALYQQRQIGRMRSHHRLVYGRQFGADWARYKQREAQRAEEKRKALAVAASIAQQQQEKKNTTAVLPDVINAVHSDAISDEVVTRNRYRPPSVEDQHFFGTWGGIQPWLVDHGINLLVSINEELAGNLTGGKKRANSNAGQVGLELDIDWQKLAGLKNFKTHTIIVNGHGRSVSSDFGDTLAASQQIYGARGNVVAHLVAMYAERSFWHERVNLNVGWMPVGSFFAASPLFCDFMNVAICGNPGPNKYTNGNRDWPSGNMGAVVHVMPLKDFYVMGGLFAVSPHGYNGGISGWSWAQSGLGKFSSPVELGWLPEFGKHHLTGHYKLGYSYDNSRYPDLYRDASGQPFLLTGRPQRYRAGMNSAWLMVDQMLLRHGPGETNGLILLGGAMYTDGKTVSVHDHEWLGMLETGRFWGRPLDTVGMMWQHLGISSSATHQQELSQALGRGFLPNRWGAVDGVQSHENIYELFYSAHVARAMALQPDFQYIQRPSATTTYHDAAVFGLQFTVVL